MKIKPLEKKVKSPKVSTLRNKADKLYQELGRLMYNKCYCGGQYYCLHHFHPKSSSSALRYEIKNGVPVCAGCHLRHHSGSDPKIQFGMRLFMESKFGDNWEIELLQQRQANAYIKTNAQYYKTQIEILQGMINACNEERNI